ncbi:MAG: response regulator [Planctomycetota bacterium]|jgi:DNA-binding NtrC family response regulator
MFRKKKIIEMRTVLFVDNDKEILHSLERGLIDEPYNTIFADSCKKALEVLHQEEVHVIVTDMRMPEIGGLEFIKIIQEKYPHIVKMVLSGYSNDAALQTVLKKGEIFKVISKPWKLRGNFEKLVRQAVEHYNLQSKSDSVRQHN